MRFLAVIVVQSILEIIVYTSLGFSAQPAAPVNYHKLLGTSIKIFLGLVKKILAYLIFFSCSKDILLGLSSGPIKTTFRILTVGIMWRRKSSHFCSISTSNSISAPIK